MNNFSNMSDSEILGILNTMADQFESGSLNTEPLNTSEINNSNVQPEAKEVDWEKMEIELEDAPCGFDVDNTPEQDEPIETPLYKIDKNGNIVFSNMRPSQKNTAYRITPDKCIIADYENMGFLERRRKTLFESEIGMSYSYKMSWEELLNAIINRFPDEMAINEFGIRGGLLLAKKMEVDPYNFTDDKLGISLYDLIEFHTMFNMLPGIEKLVLDEKATERMVLTYGDSANSIWNMFQEAPNLQLLRIKTSNGWKDHRRSSFANTASELDNQLKESRARSELQYKFDVLNPRKSEMSKGYAYRVKENAKDMRKHSFNIAKEAFMAPKPKLFTTVLYSGIGLGLMGVGAVSSVFHGVGALFKSR